MPLESDPICLLLDDDHDIVVPFRFARGSAAVKQGIHSRWKLIKGEVFSNRAAGVAWMENDIVTEDQAIIGQPYDPDKIENELRKVVSSTPGANAATLKTSISYDGNTRTVTVEYEVETIFDDTIVDALDKEI